MCMYVCKIHPLRNALLEVGGNINAIMHSLLTTSDMYVLVDC